MQCMMDGLRLLEYLRDPDGQVAFAAHVAGCNVCQTRLAALRVIALGPADKLSCEEAEPALLAWLQTGDEASLPGPLANHLVACPACRQTVGELRGLDAALSAGALRAPARIPQPDLGFLAPAARPGKGWRQQVGDAAARGAYWLLERSGALWLNLGQSMQIQGAAALSPVKSGAAGTEPLLQVSLVPHADLSVELVARTAAHDAARIDVDVLVRRPSRFAAGFAGTEVEIFAPGTSYQGVTDVDGRAHFEGLSRDDLPDLEVRVAA